jgi:hypothetical protein
VGLIIESTQDPVLKIDETRFTRDRGMWRSVSISVCQSLSVVLEASWTRTYNPLAGSHMISPARTFASVLARSGVAPRRSCAVVADAGRFVSVSGDQSGNLIMHLVSAAGASP